MFTLIPLLLNILAIATLRGNYRTVAMIVVPFISFAFFVDYYGTAPAEGFLAIPLFLNFMAIAIYRGAYRIGAMIILPLTGFAFFVDHESASQHGTLTGLLTIMISGPMLVVLLLLGLGNLIALRKPPHSGQSLTAGEGAVSGATPADRLIISRASRWGISGAVLSVCVMIVIAVLGGIFRPSQLSIMTDMLLDKSAGFALWVIGASLGAIAGASLAWATGARRHR